LVLGFLGGSLRSWCFFFFFFFAIEYNDIVVLPIGENMNYGKSHTFFSWAATMAWVPPVFVDTPLGPRAQFSYSNVSASPPTVLAAHDPPLAWTDLDSDGPREWVRPDFVVKADDDSFVMLAELEARLRVALHTPLSHHSETSSAPVPSVYAPHHSQQFAIKPRMLNATARTDDVVQEAAPTPLSADPLVYWGYLVKQRFMAGELYALSWSLVTYAATDATVKTHLRGAEDKQTASWMRLHPHAAEIRWMNERCWIYDHPKAGTVYSHGFLFPSEVARVRRTIKSHKELSYRDAADTASGASKNLSSNAALSVPPEWSQSTVSTFRTRYAEPIPGLSTLHSVEALVEGSQMSQLHEGSILTPELAWKEREGRTTRYEGQRLGGTVVVHFIKKNIWYLETALALLGGDDATDLERMGRRHVVS